MTKRRLISESHHAKMREEIERRVEAGETKKEIFEDLQGRYTRLSMMAVAQ